MKASGSALVRICLVLRSFLDGDAVKGPTEIARNLGLPVSTAHRLLKTLSDQGFLLRNEALGQYSLGPLLLRLAAKVKFPGDLRMLSRPIMEELNSKTGEAVLLSVVFEGMRLCIEQVESSHPLRHLVRIGGQSPLYAASAPKVLLAHLSEQEQEDVLAQISSHTKNTVTDIRLMRNELREIRLQNYAITEGEYIDGVSSVAAPIRDHTGTVVAAINIGGPSLRLTRIVLEKYVPLVTQAAMDISTLLGYSSDLSAQG